MDVAELTRRFRGMTPTDIAVLVDTMSHDDLLRLRAQLRDGILDARAAPRFENLTLLDHQKPPPGDWGTWLLLGGRGTGKTSGASAEVYRHVMFDPPCIPGIPGGHHVAMVAPTLGDASSSVNADGGLRTLDPRVREVTRKGGTVVEFPNGAILGEFGAHAPADVDRLRAGARGGFCFAWAEELAAWRQVGYDQDSWDLLLTALRLGPNPRLLGSTTPKPTPLIRELFDAAQDPARPDYVLTAGTTYDNPYLSARFISRIRERYAGTRLEAQELLGVLLDEVEGALWSLDLLNSTRLAADAVPRLSRVVVGVDPAFSEEIGSDETGIVVAGRGAAPGSARTEVYVLDDLSGDYGAYSWPQIAVDAYHRHDAYSIVAEANLGGRDFIRRSIHAIDPTVKVDTVHATEGKRTRAEPVAALYERQRAHHVGTFPLLESEQTTWTPGDRSPNRLDAVVWAITDLARGLMTAPASATSAVGRGRLPRRGR